MTREFMILQSSYSLYSMALVYSICRSSTNILCGVYGHDCRAQGISNFVSPCGGDQVLGTRGDQGTLTIWLFNIAMENHHFLMSKPSTNGPFSIAMLNNQRVISKVFVCQAFTAIPGFIRKFGDESWVMHCLLFPLQEGCRIFWMVFSMVWKILDECNSQFWFYGFSPGYQTDCNYQSELWTIKWRMK